MIFWKRKRAAEGSRNDQTREAEEALGKSLSDLADLEKFTPTVEAVVRRHRQLQFENHFSERIALAYRGENP